MHIVQIYNCHRYDFDALLECEFCKEEQTAKNCYNDFRWHNQVLPAIKCISCLKRTNESIPEGITDPEFHGGVKIFPDLTEVEKDYLINILLKQVSPYFTDNNEEFIRLVNKWRKRNEHNELN